MGARSHPQTAIPLTEPTSFCLSTCDISSQFMAMPFTPSSPSVAVRREMKVMKAKNQKTMSVSLEMKLSTQRSCHRSWVKWLELALTLTAIALHIAAHSSPKPFGQASALR